MRATPQPISSSKSCLSVALPETLIALERPADAVTSVKITGEADSAANERARGTLNINAAPPFPSTLMKSRRDCGRPKPLLTPASSRRCGRCFGSVSPHLVQFRVFPVQLAESAQGLVRFRFLSEFPVEPGQNVIIRG